MEISTPVQRDRVDRIITARTLPCQVKKVDKYTLEIVLQEGRNRQIRRMLVSVCFCVCVCVCLCACVCGWMDGEPPVHQLLVTRARLRRGAALAAVRASHSFPRLHFP